jgi:threonine dehydratase
VQGLRIVPADIIAAERRIGPSVWPTPLMPDAALEARQGAPVWLKLECWQRTGSFKVRGASNAMRLLGDEDRRRGVLAVSAGNHAQGVALAAREAGVSALIVMPETASRVKIEAVRQLGAEVRLLGRDYDEAEAAWPAVAQETGRALVHPFMDPAVIAGQGTVGLEIALERPGVRQVLIPAGGGGLSVGSAIALKALLPEVRVYGVQTEASPPLVASYKAGRHVAVTYGPSIADGLHGDTTSEMVDLALRHVDGVLEVTEASTRRAMRYLFRTHRIVAEGSAAVGVAALLDGLAPDGETAVVVTGRNIAPELFQSVLAEEVTA